MFELDAQGVHISDREIACVILPEHADIARHLRRNHWRPRGYRLNDYIGTAFQNRGVNQQMRTLYRGAGQAMPQRARPMVAARLFA